MRNKPPSRITVNTSKSPVAHLGARSSFTLLEVIKRLDVLPTLHPPRSALRFRFSWRHREILAATLSLPLLPSSNQYAYKKLSGANWRGWITTHALFLTRFRKNGFSSGELDDPELKKKSSLPLPAFDFSFCFYDFWFFIPSRGIRKVSSPPGNRR